MDQTAAHRRDPVAEPDRRAVTGRAVGLRPDRQTVYGLFRRWQRNGTWRQILTALQARTIPQKADQIRHRKARGRAGGRPPAFDPELYKQRHAVECGIVG